MRRYFLAWLNKFFINFYYFLPVRLLASQLRKYPLFLFIWLFLFGVVGNKILTTFGASYLFLDPEYQGVTDFWASLWIGIFLGAFTVSFHLASYILDGPRFYFLATQKRPFLTFSLNNSTIPGLFWLFYFFQIYNYPFAPHENPFVLILGILTGGILWLLISAGYFQLTNKNAEKILGKRILNELKDPLKIKQKSFLYRKKPQAYAKTFLSPALSIIRVHPIEDEDKDNFLKVLNQNHNNALIFQIAVLVLLSLISIFSEIPFFQIPAAASFLMLFTFIIMIYGAILFWFRRLGVMVMLILIAMFSWFQQITGWTPISKAFGIQYPTDSSQKPKYNEAFLYNQANDSLMKASLNEHHHIFQQWKQKQLDKDKPILVILCVSGGGSRSALWTTTCLQYLDSITNHRFSDALFLITGASGGMIGAAYYRELLLNYPHNSYKFLPIHRDNISKDILNRISLALATQFFTLPLNFTVNNISYRKERGYHFEQQLKQNTNLWFYKSLGDYYLPEKMALVPMIFFTPTILNDGRKLLISPLNNALLTQSFKLSNNYQNECNYVEFKQLFRGLEADSLRFTSAIRMNATFPYILPNVLLPSNPPLKIMDAGLTDNFGSITAAQYIIKYLLPLKNQFRKIILLQIRDTPQSEPIAEMQTPSVLDELLSFFSDSYNSIANNGDYSNDQIYDLMRVVLPNQFEVLELQYEHHQHHTKQLDPWNKPASLSFHLTQREKNSIIAALYSNHNQKIFHELQKQLSN